MKLYGSLASPYVARALLVSRWKGCGLELTPPPGGSIKSAEYLAVNPLGKMPALEDNGRCLAESTVICEYIDETQAGRKLMPGDAMDRAQARLIARLVDIYVVPNTGALFRNANPAQRNDADVQACLATLRKAVGDLEKFIGEGPWAAGGSPGFPDAIMAPTFWVLFALLPMFGVKDFLAGLPKLTRWHAAAESDPVSGPLHKEYDAAFRAFLQSRLKAG
ncbi:MAG: glutathione S-transferase family protein [Steroidobacteraceae bacterium]|nr:glutathione S-transferase family protein [Steroidobacteraceae bacterium]